MHKVLIANRSEIACRINRAAHKMGLRTVAIHSTIDKDSMHVATADESVEIDDPDPRRSYLDSSRIIEAALRRGADAVHPGYGFLSENAEFAGKVEQAGLIWIGPTPDSIRQMGDKEWARQVAVDAGVPIVPGTGRLDAAESATFAAQARAVGYPLLVKAAGGGGGIGMSLVNGPEELLKSIETTSNMAQRSFNNGAVFLERFISRARHIEVQIFGFGDRNAIHTHERECSVQRRFQKIVEESPSTALSPPTRAAIARAAVILASRVNYRGAGTVEFIYDGETAQFYFLEMNTRIQVEHPVTEMVTGLDLVEMQLRLASGERINLLQDDVRTRGHAIECRLCAENPAKRFFPSPGKLTRLHFPEGSAKLRIETGLRSGDTVTPYYDSMIAKIIGWGETRDAAIAETLQALRQTHVQGINTNREFLVAILQHRAFATGETYTSFVDTHLTQLLSEAAQAQ